MNELLPADCLKIAWLRYKGLRESLKLWEANFLLELLDGEEITPKQRTRLDRIYLRLRFGDEFNYEGSSI